MTNGNFFMWLLVAAFPTMAYFALAYLASLRIGAGRARKRPRPIAKSGIPDNAGAWLTGVAKRRAIGMVRHHKTKGWRERSTHCN